jgi:hypothetical protein
MHSFPTEYAGRSALEYFVKAAHVILFQNSANLILVPILHPLLPIRQIAVEAHFFMIFQSISSNDDGAHDQLSCVGSESKSGVVGVSEGFCCCARRPFPVTYFVPVLFP